MDYSRASHCLMKKIVVLTSGGDAPGMNAAIRAVVRTGAFCDVKIYGCMEGFQGLVNRTLRPLDPESVANTIQYGGTMLKADRCEAFYEKKVRDECRTFLKQHAIDGIIVIGGNGSFKGAALLSSEGGPAVIGIPGTIDNDIPGTEYTIGFDTARNTALNAIDKIRDTASSHNRNFLIEVMGRSSGFLAVDVGMAGGAEFILTPEFDISLETLAKNILMPRRQKLSSIIIVAEASEPGRSVQLAQALEQLTKETFRVCILGHTQRGGSPTLLDRKIASQMGYMAVQALTHGASHKMIAMCNNELKLQNFPDVDAGPRVLNQKDLIEINNILCT
jgi:6-phosphofructokinase 1